MRQRDGRQSAFDRLVEDLRLQAFHVYEAVRAAQRRGSADTSESMRDLGLAASLASDLVHQVAMLQVAAALDAGEDLVAVAPI